MDGDDSVSEDEWTCIKRRFSLEGLEWDNQEPNSRTLYVWRLLVDAEANLKAARHVSDKLRRQYDEEKVELENYTEHLRIKCEERVKELDDEVKVLKEDLEALLAGTQAVTAMLLKEGLEDVAHSSLGEQIAYLLVERSKLTEELNVAKTNPTCDRDKELTSQLIKVTTDFEVLKRTHQESENRLSEMKDRVSLLEKASRQLEMDNETLAYKLSEALAEIEDNEGQLRRYIRNSSVKRSDSISLQSQEDYGPPSFRSLPLSKNSFKQGDNYCQSFRRRESPRNSGRQKKTEPLRTERGKSPRNSGRRRQNTRSLSHSRTGTEPREFVYLSLSGNLDLPDAQRSTIKSGEPTSPQKLKYLLDGQIQNSKNQIIKLEDLKNIQAELDSVKRDLLEAGDKYEYIVRKYELYKIKSKNKISVIRSKYNSEMAALKKKISHLEGKINLLEDKLRTEESLGKELERNLSKVRTERQEMAAKVRESERLSQEYENQMKLLQEKIDLVQDANNQLNEQLQQLSITAVVG